MFRDWLLTYKIRIITLRLCLYLPKDVQGLDIQSYILKIKNAKLPVLIPLVKNIDNHSTFVIYDTEMAIIYWHPNVVNHDNHFLNNFLIFKHSFIYCITSVTSIHIVINLLFMYILWSYVVFKSKLKNKETNKQKTLPASPQSGLVIKAIISFPLCHTVLSPPFDHNRNQ